MPRRPVEQKPGKLASARLHVTSAVSLATALSAVVGVVGGFVWLVAKNELQDFFRQFAGVHEITEVQTQHGEKLSNLTTIVERNAITIDSLIPEPVIAVYDKVRSKVYSPCVVGTETCEYQLRVRRTEFGLACDVPTVIARVVIDHSGLENVVRNTGAMQVTRIGQDWSTVRSAFALPSDIQPGVAEFIMTLRYTCPDGQIDTETIPLTFMISHNYDSVGP